MPARNHGQTRISNRGERVLDSEEARENPGKRGLESSNENQNFLTSRGEGAQLRYGTRAPIFEESNSDSDDSTSSDSEVEAAQTQERRLEQNRATIDSSDEETTAVTQSEIAVIPNNIGEMDNLYFFKKNLSKVNFNTLPMSPAVKHVSMLNCQVTVDRMSAFFYRLETLAALSVLDLSGTKMEAVSFANAPLPLTLNVFRLRKCDIRKFKFNNLYLLPELKEIDFSYNDLSTCSFNQKSFPAKLIKLNLENTGLAPDSKYTTRDLLDAVRELAELEELNLSRNDLSPHSNTFLTYMPTSIRACILEHTKIRMSEITKMDEVRAEMKRLVHLKSLSFPNIQNKKVRAKFHSVIKETGYQHQDYNVDRDPTHTMN